MRIIHVTESHGASGGGVFTVVDQLARRIVASGGRAHILSVGNDVVTPPRGVELTNIRPWPVPKSWYWSPKLRPQIRALVQHPEQEVLHIHGVWRAAQWHGARLAGRNHTPFLISAHGQLQPYHWTDRGALHRAKKKVYWRLLAQPAFRNASAIHAITSIEKAHLTELFASNRIEVIPNAADLEEVDAELRHLARSGSVRRRPVIAFLGRLHPVKGVDVLIKAFTMLGLPSEWRLLLAGPVGDRGYMARLEQLVTGSPARSRIEFVGPLAAGEKWKFFCSAAVVALPSFSEVIGMVNLESAACGTPTVTTFESGLADWEEGGGILIRPNAYALAEALNLICSLSTAEYQARCAASRRLVEERYSWAVVQPRWHALYKSLVA